MAIQAVELAYASALMLALDEMRDDLVSEESEEAEEAGEEFDADEDESRFSGGSAEAVHIQESVLRHLWKTLYKGARTSARDKVCLFIGR